MRQKLLFIIKSILYYKWQYLSLFAGMLLSTAVITGALITGDSVKLSLRKLVELRLGNTGFAMQTGDRFFTIQLAEKISLNTGLKTAALIQKNGSAINPGNSMRAGKIFIYGVDDDFFRLTPTDFRKPAPGQAMISKNLAAQLGLNTGDDIIIRMESSGEIPADLLFAPENYLPVSIRLKVSSIAGDGYPGRFSLQNNQVAPFNVFINRIEMTRLIETSGLANLLIIENSKNIDATVLNEKLSKLLCLQDAGVKIEKPENEIFYELSGRRIFLDTVISNAALRIKPSSIPVLTYLINSIETNKHSTPYSFVTATMPPVSDHHPGKHEIIINSWLANDLQASIGDTLTLKYFIQSERKKIISKSAQFAISHIIPLKKSSALQSLMPEIPGLADAGSCSEWDAGIPIDLSAIREKDEIYWDDYRGTPKAFVSYPAGKELWGNKFGNTTAIRFFADSVEMKLIENEILREIDPLQLGLQITNVRRVGLQAATNGVDFGELFLALSFFVIAAGLLLTGLLFQLHIQKRSREDNIFSALGFGSKYIFSIRILETLPVLIPGAIAGAFTGILYTKALMAGINSVWRDIVQNTVLWLFINPQTLIIGALAGFLIAFSIIFFVAVRKHQQRFHIQSLNSLYNHPPSKWFLVFNTIIMVTTIFTASFLLVFSIFSNSDQNTFLTLIAGALYLMGFLTIYSTILKTVESKHHQTALKPWQFAIKNAGRNKNRSVATIALIALGAFTIIVTGANRQTFVGKETRNDSGTGGFLFWVETAIPLIYDLNTVAGKEKYALDDEPVLEEAVFFQIYNLSGDDASCLNLNQVDQPQLLGINTASFHKRGSFSFSRQLGNIDPDNIWPALNKPSKSGIIPAIADQTVITWGLMKKVGDTLVYINDAGKEIRLVLIAGLRNSIFQGNILISDSIFLQHFPNSGSSQIILVDAPAERKPAVEELLRFRLADLGAEITPTNARLAAFNAVTNTYLSVFTILGGLGIFIGIIGLAIVITRNIRERKSEIALLAAIGFNRSHIIKIIFLENFLLLMAGIFSGMSAAMAGIIPTILSSSFTMSTTTLAIMLFSITVNGIFWIFVTAGYNIKGKLSEALRND
jgi:putative ABC transport system permease protein